MKWWVEKGLALIAANDVTAPDSGFNVDTNRVTILDRDGGGEALPLLSKEEVGHTAFWTGARRAWTRRAGNTNPLGEHQM